MAAGHRHGIPNFTGQSLFVRLADRPDLQESWFFQRLEIHGEVDVRGADLLGANLDDAH